MSTLENFVAVDWRSGKDKIFFFFKDSNTYSRFHIGNNRVDEGYPKPVKYSNWHDFHVHAKDLRFGFTSTSIEGWNLDQDILWLFYYDASTPMVCKYDQDSDKVMSNDRVEDTIWENIVPYFDRIVAGTWWQVSVDKPFVFRFIMNNGHFLYINIGMGQPDNKPYFRIERINDSTWPGLAPYKDRIITAVQNDRSLADSYYYIFLTDNEYITYNIPEKRMEYGPKKVDNDTWPGLLRGPRPEMSATASGFGVEASVSIPAD
ncbi:hypothetical protein PS903_03780 [Pseudomonas fluorescens]|nr:hypothetical protein PS903_03780 [Pseudomonas fluorescens]